MRTINDAGRKLIERHEQLRLEAYPDPVSKGDPWTIGWGHTGRDVHPGLRISTEKAEQLFEQDLAEAERLVERFVHAPLSDNQFSALVSAAFNLGVRLFQNLDCSPTHLVLALNAQDMAGAADQILRFDHSCGRVVAELTRRRHEERELFLTLEKPNP